MKQKFISLIMFNFCIMTHAELQVKILPPKTTGNKTLIKAEMVNAFQQPVESARAACFLLDEKGKMVGQTTQWVIGGTKHRPPLPPGKTNIFNFVISTQNGASTNLQARITFTRIVLEGGTLANHLKDIQILTNTP